MPDPRLLLLSPGDNVFVLRASLEAGETVTLDEGAAQVAVRLGMGHKIARHPIAKGEGILKYGARIGTATADIAPGEHVHVHNVQSDHTPTYALTGASEEVPR